MWHHWNVTPVGQQGLLFHPCHVSLWRLLGQAQGSMELRSKHLPLLPRRDLSVCYTHASKTPVKIGLAFVPLSTGDSFFWSFPVALVHSQAVSSQMWARRCSREPPTGVWSSLSKPLSFPFLCTANGPASLNSQRGSQALPGPLLSHHSLRDLSRRKAGASPTLSIPCLRITLL